MAAMTSPPDAALCGVLERDASIRKYTWFRVGGPADVLYRPADADDLADFLGQWAATGRAPAMPLGVGSNLLIRDGGLDGAVVHLGKAFGEINIDGDTITAGAGALDIQVSDRAQAAGLAGLEFLRGIPGTIGGAVAMNAGAYCGDMAGCLIDVDVLLPDGTAQTLSAAALDLSYRKAYLPAGAIVISARLRGQRDDPGAIAARVEAIIQAREDSQPLRTRTGGSTFKNPDPAMSGGRKAWQLIDEAGCRGLTHGGAQVSEKHCNFLINTGNATAADLEALGEDVRTRVKAHSGVLLEWEIKRIGRASS